MDELKVSVSAWMSLRLCMEELIGWFLFLARLLLFG
jgi:hypothetical protein